MLAIPSSMSHAGSSDHSSLVVMSKGTKFTQQSYKVADTFPFEWIKKKWKEGFHITGLATGGGEKTPQWAVVMSRAAGFSDQCIELDFQYPSEGIHRRWDSGILPSPHPTLLLSFYFPLPRHINLRFVLQ